MFNELPRPLVAHKCLPAKQNCQFFFQINYFWGKKIWIFFSLKDDLWLGLALTLEKILLKIKIIADQRNFKVISESEKWKREKEKKTNNHSKFLIQTWENLLLLMLTFKSSNMGQCRPLFVYFRRPHITMQILIEKAKCRCCAWDSNPGPQYCRCRRIH